MKRLSATNNTCKSSKLFLISENRGWIDISAHLRFRWIFYIFCILASIFGFSSIIDKLSFLSLIK
jgi:hypothetical protein